MAEQTVAQQQRRESPSPRVARRADGIHQARLRSRRPPASDADILAGLMVEADLRGSDTHGVIRLPLYLRRLKAGGVNPRPNIRIVQEKPATALVDGDNGMGHLVMRFAAMTAIEKARQPASAGSGARMSNHAGPAALYAMMPLAHDMIGLYLAVGSNNHLPPWGSTENLLGTNPIAIAIPRRESRRSCSTWRRRSPPSARCAQDAARRGDAGRLDDRP
jgi:LDH2 family malate/lactate/ureidoglycolate dehydrogenase